MLSAGAWHRDRLIERQAARVAADRAADVAAEPVQPAEVEPALMVVAAPSPQPSEAQYVAPVPEARLDLKNGGPWTV